MQKLLSNYDAKIADVKIQYGPDRAGDVKHSLASIDKAKTLLGYDPQYQLNAGLDKAIEWYWNYFKS